MGTTTLRPVKTGDEGKEVMWEKTLNCLTEELLGPEVIEELNLKGKKLGIPIKPNEPVLMALDGFMVNFFLVTSAGMEYLNTRKPFLSGEVFDEKTRAAHSMRELFWAKLKLENQELWGKNIGVRLLDDDLVVVELAPAIDPINILSRLFNPPKG